MKVSRCNNKAPSSVELQDLEKLQALIERAVADGKLTKYEMESIQAAIRADGKISFEELELCRQLIWEKIQSGELEYDWWN